MDEQRETASPVTIFYSYAPEDELFREQLENHLRLLSRQGLISEWHDRQIVGGTEWARQVDEHLETASIILLLISADFLASDYCYGVEMQRALERHRAGEARVIPILLRPVDWESTPFAFLPCLPRDARPITQWKNQNEALIDIVTGIRTAINHLSMIDSGKARTSSPMTTTRQHTHSPLARNNRQRMLKRVQAIWIEGLLEHSLHNAALIELGLHEQLDAVSDPWRLAVQELDRPARSLPPGTRITQVYDAAGGELLILGEPGSGKTTLLLELARDLLDRAEQDDTLPMPVVFNLSSWATKRQPLSNWLVEELNSKYQVPRKLAQSWVDANQVMPLLDGLDEVDPTQRAACVDAINAYRQEHGLVPMVVCSRSSEYLNQAARLTLRTAVIVQPLTSQQIDEYLILAGPKAEAIRTMLNRNAALREMVASPLMLSILTLAYQDLSEQSLKTDTPDMLQQQIFATYVKHMLTRRGVQVRYTTEQMLSWLAWLARQMRQRDQTVFFIERLQPDWLLGSKPLWLYNAVIGVVIGIAVGTCIGLVVGQILGVIGGVVGGVIGGILGGVISQGKTEIQLAEVLVFWWRNIWRNLATGLAFASAGILGGILGGTLGIQLVGTLTGVLAGALSAGLIGGLAGGFSTTTLDDFNRTVPNQGAWLSARNSIIVALISGLVGGLAIGLTTNLSTGLTIGFSIGLVAGLVNGGLACTQHVTLRLLLWDAGVIPWNYVRFLDDAAERVLLRKIGGGYIFVHRLLLDYFAALQLIPASENTLERNALERIEAARTERLQDTQRSLFAIAHVTLEDDDRAIVGKIYTVQAGVSQRIPEDFLGEPFRVSVQNPAEPLSFGILLHPSENIELLGAHYQPLHYDLLNAEPQLISCPFRLRAPGRGYLVINFYRERQWLKTMRFEFDSTEQSVLSTTMRGG